MKKVKNEDVMYNFVEMRGNCSNHAESLVNYGDKLVNYSTILAQWTRHGLTINITKYTPTTTKLQNKLIEMVKNKNNVHFLSKIPKDYSGDLTAYVESYILTK